MVLNIEITLVVVIYFILVKSQYRTPSRPCWCVDSYFCCSMDASEVLMGVYTL